MEQAYWKVKNKYKSLLLAILRGLGSQLGLQLYWVFIKSSNRCWQELVLNLLPFLSPLTGFGIGITQMHWSWPVLLIQMHPFHFVVCCALTETVSKVVEWCYPLNLVLIQCTFDQVCSNNVTVGLGVMFWRNQSQGNTTVGTASNLQVLSKG